MANDTKETHEPRWLGSCNSWKATPEIVYLCRLKKHELIHTKDGFTTHTTCLKCNYTFTADTSD